ncbi:beta-phosphoglucomutase [Alkalihalobacillus sp. LMS39]|uniref:beta-phosphoglucomutase n=1 Tax=Alkalihalobacillus sp. LMS39 TaxID=2924032 RepID=UPI001FB3FB43|nr:beta-phosphoglucomutase [Alkalihalobacillus sp. LMS39]UOE94024.1 beta-phosphoglucomutase [Alkalihalobacillus sp. LMS39]
MKKTLAAVIFDLDGVLANTVEFHYLATKKVADDIGVPFTREQNLQMQGRGRNILIEELVKASTKAFTDEEKLVLGERKNEYYQELIETITAKDVLPGMEELIDELRQNQIKVAVASSSSNAKTVLGNLQLLGVCDYVVDITTVKALKPDPEIFLKAADELGIPYAHCIGIEDSEAGIIAINEAPMFSIGIGHHPNANWQVGRTDEITYEKMVEQFNKEC